MKQIIAANIVRLREQGDMTQLELGRALGFQEPHAQTRISQYETGKRSPGKATLEKIAGIFSVPVDALLRDEPKKVLVNGRKVSMIHEEQAEYLTSEPSDPLTTKLLLILRSLDVASRKTVLQYAEERKQLLKMKGKGTPK